ncbi:MAG: DUF167 domain-containing protein [Candidatus Uhrbacteria bacterium]|nr:DUF167 domain-containing protein [Patescibacteria group bacterium]MBU1907344.1 DUF167 domain-containing protein [Patescibacteria group bacterium]
MRLTVFVKPNARENRVDGWVDERTVKIKIAAPPKEGRANRELIIFLADRLGIAKSTIELIHGHTMIMKQLELPLSENEVRAKLMENN